MKQRLATSLVLLGLFLAAWLPRMAGLDGFVTIDERKWLARSANFYAALSEADWHNTFQREHPGVTIMWAGTLAFLQHYPTYPQEAPGQFTWEREHFEAWLTTHTDYTPLELLAAGRQIIALFISLAIALSYLPLRRLVGQPIAAVATLFIAWDPFAVAMSQQLHPDGFVASLFYLALILWLSWLYAGQRWRDLIASGVVMGLAWLTKTPAIFLVPAAGILLFLPQVWRTKRWTSPLTIAVSLRAFVIWGAIATATFVLLWPSMWVDPLNTLLRMGDEMSEYVERHTTINYFWGQPVDDPGVIFYPVAFLFRTTPAVLIGLIATAVAAWYGKLPSPTDKIRRLLLGLSIFALVLAAGMTLGAKKFDRYLLPAFPALAVIGAVGWVVLGTWLTRWLGRLRPIGLALLAAFLLHGLLGFLHYPYYLTYYNPVMGGPRAAAWVLFAGWGEGIDEAARWLNAQPDATDLRVVSWYADGPFSYFFEGQEVMVSEDSPLYWLDTDYHVLYINQWQRQLPSPEAIAWFTAQPAAHTVKSGGLELARIYETRSLRLPDFVALANESAGNFGDQIRLSAYTIPRTVAQPGEQLPVTFYLQSLAPMQTNYNVLVRLVGQDGQEIWREDGWPWGAPTSDWPLREIRPDGHTIQLPADAAPGLYQLNLSFYDPATLVPLPITSGELAGDSAARAVALIWVGTEPAASDPATWHFGEMIALTAAIADAPQAGSELPITLHWTGLSVIDTDYTIFAHIVNAAGETVAQRDQPPLQGFAPTRLWVADQPIHDEMRVLLPADLPAGQYEVRIGLYTLENGRLQVTQQGQAVGDYATIGTFDLP
jgi:hypothetical protein